MPAASCRAAIHRETFIRVAAADCLLWIETRRKTQERHHHPKEGFLENHSREHNKQLPPHERCSWRAVPANKFKVSKSRKRGCEFVRVDSNYLSFHPKEIFWRNSSIDFDDIFLRLRMELLSLSKSISVSTMSHYTGCVCCPQPEEPSQKEGHRSWAEML